MPEEYECDECGRSFDTERGLSSHQRQAHGDDDGDATAGIKLTGVYALSAVLVVGILAGFSAGTVLSGSAVSPAQGAPGEDVSITD
ncbi:MAG: C2H2-type zinc finger protein, partial [Candidatus Nanohaloarchaea archaeon]